MGEGRGISAKTVQSFLRMRLRENMLFCPVTKVVKIISLKCSSDSVLWSRNLKHCREGHPGVSDVPFAVLMKSAQMLPSDGPLKISVCALLVETCYGLATKFSQDSI